MMVEVEATGAGRAQGSWRSWLIVVVLMLTMIFSLVDRFAISLLVEPIKADLRLTDSDIGLLSGIAFGLFYACMGLPMGLLADRWSRKGTILLGVGVWSIATAGCGLASNFFQLLLARIGVGAGEAGLAPASYSIISDLFPRESLSRAMSVFQMGATLGSGIALWLVGIIFTSFTDGAGARLIAGTGLAAWHATFLLVALPGLPFLLIIASLRLNRTAAPAAGGSPAGTLVSALRRRPAFYGLSFATMSGLLLVNYAMLSWVPAFIQREFGSNPAEIGATYGAIMLLICPAAMIGGGWVADFLDGRGVRGAHALIMLAAAVLVLLFALLLLRASTLAQVYVAVALIHFAVTLPVGVAPALIQLRTMPDVRARIGALYVLIVNLVGLGIGPVIVGGLSDRMSGDPAGLRHSVALVSLIVTGGALATGLLLVRHLRKSGDDRR
ncbi:MFS transporter [Rhizorhabdus wittichii DC-6]|nr:MFS transporter [Rhizorhabdus wittichii DC-6]